MVLRWTWLWLLLTGIAFAQFNTIPNLPNIQTGVSAVAVPTTCVDGQLLSLVPPASSPGLQYCHPTNTWTAVGGGGAGNPGGTPNQVQYNAAGSFGGFTISGDSTLVVATGVMTNTGLNGAAIPISATILGTNGSGQPIAATTTGSGTTAVLNNGPTLIAPILGTPASGTLTNTTGLPAAGVVAGALANGMTATTQSVADNSTKLATDAFVLANSFTNPMTTLGDSTYGGTSGVATRLAGPTSPNGVPQYWTDTPSGGLAVAESWSLPGIVGRVVTGTSDTILSTDCNPTRIEYTSTSAVAVTLPTATTLAVPNCTFKVAYIPASGTAALTITPTTWTINGASTLVLQVGQRALILPDPNSATNWQADVVEPAVTAGSNITLTRTLNGLSVASSGSTQLFVVNPQTTTYQVLASDFAACKTITVASGTFTVTLVASGSQPPSGQCIQVVNYGSGVVTIARSSQNINGLAANFTLSAGSASAPTSAFVVSDGTNYFATVDEGTVGTVTSIATTSPITGGTITSTGTIACATCVTSAASLTNNALMTGAGSQASQTVTTGTGVVTALGVNTGSAGAFVVNGGALGTPSSGTLTNATGLPINGVVSATGAIATIADGNNPLVVNCALTSGTTCLTTGETTAATTAGAVEHQITTLTTTTAIPLQITQGAAGPANAAAPNVINVSAAAAGGAAGASNAGSTGAGYSLPPGAGSNGGATTGNGGNAGGWTIAGAVGGNAGGTSTNNGGTGSFWSWTGGGGGNGGTGVATAGSGGGATWTMGAPGTNSATGTAGTVGLFNVTGNAPASTANAAGVNAGTVFQVTGVAGGACTGAACTGGVGSSPVLNAGVGGSVAGASGNAIGGGGGNFTINAGAGTNSINSAANSAGGNIILNPGAAGTGGSGTAGKAGVVSVTGPGAGFVGFQQGAAVTTSNTQVPANTIIEQAPTAVTAYTITKPSTAASGLSMNATASAISTQSNSGDANHAVSQLSKTALVTTFTVCAATAGTACGQVGQYRISYNFWGSGTACSSVTAGSVGLNLTWTDENAQAHTTVSLPMYDQKAATTGILFNFNTALTTESAGGSFVISTNGTIIQAATTYTACTTGTGTYNLRMTVEQLQ